jgi:hypothetical protein
LIEKWNKNAIKKPLNPSGFLFERQTGFYKNNTAGNTATANTIKIHSARQRFKWPV